MIQHPETKKDYAPCSVARLLSAMLGTPLEDEYPLVGLLLCPVCKQASTDPGWYPYCGKQHYRKDNSIGPSGAQSVELVCDECAITFLRRVSDIVNAARPKSLSPAGIHHIFCSKQCQGKWLGTNHGIQFGQTKLKKEYCKRGHPRSGDNLYTSPKGERQCRVCSRINWLARYKRLKELNHDNS